MYDTVSTCTRGSGNSQIGCAGSESCFVFPFSHCSMRQEIQISPFGDLCFSLNLLSLIIWTQILLGQHPGQELQDDKDLWAQFLGNHMQDLLLQWLLVAAQFGLSLLCLLQTLACFLGLHPAQLLFSHGALSSLCDSPSKVYLSMMGISQPLCWLLWDRMVMVRHLGCSKTVRRGFLGMFAGLSSGLALWDT